MRPSLLRVLGLGLAARGVAASDFAFGENTIFNGLAERQILTSSWTTLLEAFFVPFLFARC